MNGKIKMMSIVASALMVSAGAAMTAQADWTLQDEDWVYLDSSGNPVADTWKKSGDNSFYLNSDGTMAVDAWIDETYYVDESGAMVTGRWVKAEEGEEGAPSSDGGWFYLDTGGKVVTDGWKTIGGNRYYFDTDGAMEYGWFTDDDGNLYYLGDENDGAAKIGWLCMDLDEEDLPDDGDVTTVLSNGESGGKWFYFQSTGKAVKATADSGYVYKTIDGNRYYFNENGVMATGWAAVETQESDDSTGISTLKYFGEENDGKMSKGWKYITQDPSDSDDDFTFFAATSSDAESSLSGDGAWYYFDSSGVPKYLSTTAATVSAATTRINANTYFFDQYGRMQSGLIGFELADNQILTVYFGNSDSDGVMKTERQTQVYDGNGDTGIYYFTASGENKGSGYTGVKNDCLYDNGKLVEAEDGSTVQLFLVNDQYYLVNESGKVQTTNKAYKSDGEYCYEYSNGTIYVIDSDKVRLGVATASESLSDLAYESVVTLSGQ